MVESKQELIDILEASLIGLEDLPERIEKEEIYDEQGIVDCDFMIAILEYMSKSIDVSNKIQKSLNRVLGIPDEDPPDIKKQKDKEGKKWTPEEILKHCRFENDILYLPNVQFNPKSYAEVKKWITEAGGKWQGGKTQGFVFDFDATRVTSILLEGKRCNLKQEFQFFETPAELADWLVSLVGDIDENDRILEPSAGRGSLVKAIKRVCPEATVDCYELMPENLGFLAKIPGVVIAGEDFEKVECKSKYSKIIANPPFSGNQDVRHVRKMYEALEDGGTMAAITSRHWQIAPESACTQFREWLEEIGAEVHEISEGEFKESGTGIATAAIVIKKRC